MTWILAATGAVFLALALNSHRPLRRPGPVMLGAFFPAWLVSELPGHFAVLAVVTTALAAAASGWPEALAGLPGTWSNAAIGAAGVAATTLALLAVWPHARMARASQRTLQRALGRGLGEDYRDRLPAHAADLLEQRPGPLWRLAVWPFAPRQVACTRGIVFHTVRGRRRDRPLLLDVYRHVSKPTNAPTLIYVHGGGWVLGSRREQGLPTIHRLAARGWTCVSISYRKSPLATWPAHIHDVKRAIAWVRTHGAEHGCNPDFIVLCGGSAGAHLASLAALTPNQPELQPGCEVDTRVQGCVCFYGVYDFVDREGHFAHGSFRRLLELAIMKRRLDGARELYDGASPWTLVGNHAPPFFLLHGDADNVAPVGAARRFRELLAEVSEAPVVYAELPGAHHCFDLLASYRAAEAAAAVEQFCVWAHADYLAAPAKHGSEAAHNLRDSG